MTRSNIEIIDDRDTERCTPIAQRRHISERVKHAVTHDPKSWAGILMGVAALITAVSTSLREPDDSPIVRAHDDTAEVLNSVSRDVRSLTVDVHTLFALRADDERRIREAAQLVESNERLDELALMRELTGRYGEEFAADVIKRRTRLKTEVEGVLRSGSRARPESSPTHTQERELLPFSSYLNNETGE